MKVPNMKPLATNLDEELHSNTLNAYDPYACTSAGMPAVNHPALCG